MHKPFMYVVVIVPSSKAMSDATVLVTTSHGLIMLLVMASSSVTDAHTVLVDESAIHIVGLPKRPELVAALVVVSLIVDPPVAFLIQTLGLDGASLTNGMFVSEAHMLS